MSSLRIEPASITAPDFDNLMAAWKLYGDSLVGYYRCMTPLTKTQLRRLPTALKRILEVF